MPLLTGVRVLDFGRFIAGPYCAALLGDLGADVFRIERVEGGEDRSVPPVADTGDGGLYLQMNRNKRCLTLDLASPAGRRIVRQLVETADVVIANLPPATLRQLGLDYDTLSTLNPRIVLATATAYGPGGPYSEQAGFDAIGQALSGAMFMSGLPDARAKIPAAPVYSPQQALDDPHIRAAGLLCERPISGSAQRAPLAPHPVEMSVDAAVFERPAPTLGQHTQEILATLGYDTEAIAALRAQGVV
ncbi:MAG TPA: CoA transferase [Rubrivivax sp.]|jgi:crotonobetainyl-CoA:carnitine CoA-transferase CaiB-like acyl-CoA transferase|nr:CoA transferase [Rubrivivax sp.]